MSLKTRSARKFKHAWTMSVCKADDVMNSVDVLNMIMDSGAEEHVISVDDWRRLGAPTLKPVQIRLRSATGDDMGVSGSFVLRGWCDDNLVEMTALVSTRATRSLCSATKLVNAGYSILMKPDESVLCHSGGGSILLQRRGKRDFLSIRVMKSREINAITFTTMKREVESLKSELRACVLVICLLLKSDFPGHLKRNTDTKPTVTLSTTIVVRFV